MRTVVCSDIRIRFKLKPEFIEFMQKMGIFVIIVVATVAVGIGLSFYGNQIVFEDLTTEVGTISLGKEFKVSSEIERDSIRGIYAVEVIDFDENIIVNAKIFDPYNSLIESEEITEQRFEEKFDLTDEGTYQLVLETSTDEEIQVFGVIGPEPDPGKKSIGFISLYILIIGLVGMSIIAVYAIKNRRK